MKNRRYHLAAAVLIACAAALPLMAGPGLVNTRGGGDSPFLLQRLHQLATAVGDGHFPVRWMPDANYGYGYPFFNFYAPLAFYVALLFRWIGFSYVRAIQLSQLAAFITAAGGMYALGRRWFGDHKWAALLTSVAYTVAPFHLVNVYVRGDSIAEFWAMAFYPLVILAVDRVVQRPEKWRTAVIWLGPAYGGLAMTHNISAMIFSPFVVLYALVMMGARRKRPLLTGTTLTAGLLLGFAVSAWFWLPAIVERTLTQLNTEITAGYFNYAYNDGYHFRELSDLVQAAFIFDPAVGGGDAFRMGLVQAVGAVLGGAALLWRRRTADTAALWLGAVGATFMLHPMSVFLWDHLPLLPYTQFPWRFLSVQAFWAAGLTGGLVLVVPRKWQAAVGLGAIGLLFTAGLGGIQPDYLTVADDDITPTRLAQYEWFTRNVGTTVGAEYLARPMQPRPYTSPWVEAGDRYRAQAIMGTADLNIITARTGRQVWQVDAREPATAVLPTMQWPGWRAALADGTRLPVSASPAGLLAVELPAGSYTIDVWLARTPIQHAAEWISLLSLLAVGGWLLFVGRRPARPWLPALSIPQTAVVAALLTVVVVLAQVARRPGLSGTVRSWDFGQMGYLHHQPAIRYGNGAVLGAVNLPSGVVTAGHTTTVSLHWDAVPPGDTRTATVGLVRPAVNFFNGVPPIAADTRPITTGTTTYTLSIPPTAPAGLYVPTVTLSDNNRPRTPIGRKRADLMLTPIRISPAPADAAETAVPERPLDGRVISVTQDPQQPRRLDVRLAWRTARPLADNLLVSLRVTAVDGREMHAAQFDVQPNYGYQPTVGWRPGEWMYDQITIYLPPEVPFEPPYLLLARLYAPGEENEVRLSRRLGRLDGPDAQALTFTAVRPSFTVPAGITPTEMVLGEPPLVALRGYTVTQTAAQITAVMQWQALGEMQADYRHFVHLLDPVTGRPVAQHDAEPQQNTYPTSQWVPGQVVADPAVVDVTQVPPGEYWLTVGLYAGPARLPVRGPEESAVGDDAILLETITVE